LLPASPAARGGLLDRLWPGISLAPSILLFLILTLLPIVNLVVMSVHNISWRQGEITVRGKGSRRDILPLPVDAGEAVAGWLAGAARGRLPARRCSCG